MYHSWFIWRTIIRNRRNNDDVKTTQGEVGSGSTDDFEVSKVGVISSNTVEGNSCERRMCIRDKCNLNSFKSGFLYETMFSDFYTRNNTQDHFKHLKKWVFHFFL